MANALRRADRMKVETIGGEQFTDAAAVVEDVPTTHSFDPQADKLAKVKAIRAQAQAFKALLRELGSNRSFSISRQRIEEAVHWAVDGIINERTTERHPT
jgi:transcriptional regulator of nitric oxide reductase